MRTKLKSILSGLAWWLPATKDKLDEEKAWYSTRRYAAWWPWVIVVLGMGLAAGYAAFFARSTLHFFMQVAAQIFM